MEFKDFILAHDADDPAALALSRSRHLPEVGDFNLALSTLEVRRKLRNKVPQWYAAPSLRFPVRLSGEQCSSAETAAYKASVAKSLGCIRIADLTGGLGVDSWAFSQLSQEVLYNEMNPALADAAKYNFKELGAGNITVSCREVTQSSVGAVLGDFKPSLLYLDPARRSSSGAKVFLLEDCSPDVAKLLPELFAACPLVMLKLSPMADITLLCSRLQGVREVHVVESEGECKELLLLLEKGWTDGCRITVYAGGETLSFSPSEESSAQVIPAELTAAPPYLFEPGKALLKSGAFKLPCARSGLGKLDANVHLYVAGEPAAELAPFGKWFRIDSVQTLDGKALKALKGIRADVTARGIPMTSSALARRYGILPGDGSVHVFAAGPWLLRCTRVKVLQHGSGHGGGGSGTAEE